MNGAPFPRPRLSSKLECAAWAGLWCVARLALLLALCDVFGYGEEFEKACAGKALLDGVPLALHQLPYHPYEGGGFVVSVLDALSFGLCGESVLALKLVAMLLGVAILAVGWMLCERFGGRPAARTFAALYVFAPESVQVNSLLALGIHYHSTLFLALVLYLAARVAITKDARPGAWFALGCASGFGLYFSYQIALTLVVVGALLAGAARRELTSPRVVWAGVGALVGATPLAWMYATTGNAVFDIHGADWSGGSKPKLELLSAFARSLFEGRPLWDGIGVLLVALVPMAALAAWKSIESRALRWVLATLVAHALLFLAAYLASGFTVGAVYLNFLLHRLTPLWFLGILITALAATHARWLRWGALALVVCGGIDAARMVRDASPGTWRANWSALTSTKGYRYSQYLQKIAPRIAGTRSQKLQTLLRFHEVPRTRLERCLGIALYGSGEGSFESVSAEIRAAGVDDPSDFYRGMGLMLMRHQGREFRPRVDAVLPFPAEIRDPLLEGIGAFGQSWEFGAEDTVLGEARLAADMGLPEALSVGLGRRLYEAVGDTRIKRYFERRKGPLFLDRSRLEAVLAEAPEATRAALRRGFEAEAAADRCAP